jgi:hypothetical protein
MPTISTFTPGYHAWTYMTGVSLGDWATIHDAVDAGAVAPNYTNIVARSNYAGSFMYYIRRQIMSFDTNSIPDNDIILSAVLYLTIESVNGTPPYDDIHIVSTTLLNLTNPQTGTGEYNQTNWGTTSLGVISPGSASMDTTLSAPINIPIFTRGSSHLGLRGLCDITDTAPTTANFITAYGSGNANVSYRPTLVVEHRPRPPVFVFGGQ